MNGFRQREGLSGGRRARIVALATVAIVIGVTVAHGDAGTAQDVAPRALRQATVAASPAASPPASPVASPATSAGEEVAPITIVGTEMKFAPAKLAIPANTDVTVIFVNRGVIPHNIRINELGIDIDVKPRQQATFVINAPSGTYRYSCDLPGHSPSGMKGTLTVS